jgi:hypothetical protein
MVRYTEKKELHPVINNLGAFAEYNISSGNQHLLLLAEDYI